MIIFRKRDNIRKRADIIAHEMIVNLLSKINLGAAEEFYDELMWKFNHANLALDIQRALTFERDRYDRLLEAEVYLIQTIKGVYLEHCDGDVDTIMWRKSKPHIFYAKTIYNQHQDINFLLSPIEYLVIINKPPYKIYESLG